MFNSVIKALIFQYHTMLSSLRSSLWACHTDATTHSIPHIMLSSLLPVGVSRRRPLHPQSFITIASTRAWPSTSVAGTLVAGTMNSITVDVPHTMLSSLLPAGVSHRRPLHPQSFIAPQAGRRVVVKFGHTSGDPLPATRRVACDGP